MKKFLSFLAFSLLTVMGCGGGPGTTPDAVAINRGCYYSGWGSSTCQTVFDDGQRGFTVTEPNGSSYMCKGSALP